MLIYLGLAVLGCTTKLAAVTDLDVAMIFVIGVIHGIGIYPSAPLVKHELGSYLQRRCNSEIKSCSIAPERTVASL